MSFQRSTTFSALQRAEIAEIDDRFYHPNEFVAFSALQRAEIAEIDVDARTVLVCDELSVLFNEPKLLKYDGDERGRVTLPPFQCSSTSRNC